MAILINKKSIATNKSIFFNLSYFFLKNKYRKTLCLSPQMTKIFQNLGWGLDNGYNIFLNFL